MVVGGRKVLFREEGRSDAEEAAAERLVEEGKGWVRKGTYEGSWKPIGAPGSEEEQLERVGIVEALGEGRRDKGKGRARDLNYPHLGNGPPQLPFHPSSSDSASRQTDAEVGSPPRKRLRDSADTLPTPHRPPVPIEDSAWSQPVVAGRSRTTQDSISHLSHTDPANSTIHSHDLHPPNQSITTTTTTTSGTDPNPYQPPLGTGLELATLYSLPNLLSEFDKLPSKLKEHFLMHCFRRSELSTIQRLSSFIAPALKFDFVSHFPTEISIAIFSFVERPGLAAAARVSRKWNDIVDSQRGIWQSRLRAEQLWYGMGSEEEHEALVRSRWEVKDRLEEKERREKTQLPAGGTTPVEERPRLPVWGSPGSEAGEGAISPSRRRRSHPLKQVYRMRHMQTANWARPKPSGGKLMFHGE